MFRWIKKLFSPKKTVVPEPLKLKEVVKDPCWKHEKFKKGCPLCRNMNHGR